MISDALKKAREYEEREGIKVTEEERPVWHFSPRIGWLNDPNGFSFYNGRYHLFYQYHPYDSFWGPMHWGHAVSDDLIRWEYLPASMAPDTDYDGAGCFSGSALTMPDGRHLIMYTGCATYGEDENGRWRQTQCIATGDGMEYTKFEDNPVIADDKMPEYGDIYEFRDPYLWIGNDGIYRALIANASNSESGATQLTMYHSEDGFRWKRSGILFEDFLKIGVMWECPNFFNLDGVQVLIASPMNMEEEEANGSVRFPKGNNVCYILGEYDEDTETYTPDRGESGRYATYRPVDLGLDFYAPQVRIMPDGRCIMIGWMQDPGMANLHDPSMKIFCMMTVPRELSVRNGQLYQWPVRELEKYRGDKVTAENVQVGQEEVTVRGISGRSMDIELEAAVDDCTEFRIRFAKKDDCYTELRFRPDQSVLTIDRSRSGQDERINKRRAAAVTCENGRLRLRILLDKWSTEVFVNGGEQVLSATYYTDLSAQEITFSAEGIAVLNITGYQLM